MPVSVIPGAAAVDGWRILVSEGEVVRYHAATLPLELHPTDTESYRHNLSNEPPRVYVVMRPAAGAFPFQPFLATASPYEAEAYTIGGDSIVEGVTMPDSLIALVQAYVDAHHVDKPFIKRQRRRADAESAERMGGGKRPGGRFG